MILRARECGSRCLVVKEHDLTSAYSINLTAKQYEDIGNIEKAKELYRINVNRGFIGVFPYDRLRIIYSKEKNWSDAVRVCEAYLKLRKINNKEKRRMQEWVTKYKGRLGQNTEIITPNQVLEQAIRSMTKQGIKNVIIPKTSLSKPFPLWVQNLKLIKENVPPFESYARVNAIEFMDSKQKRFYFRFVDHWKRGTPIDVKGYISYLFPYALSVLHNITNNPSDTIYELRLLQQVYNHEEKFSSYLKHWIFDAYTFNKEFWNAIGYIQSRYRYENKYFTSRILSLKYAMEAPISGSEILGLLPRKPRKLIIENQDFITNHLEHKVRNFENEHNVDFLSIITVQFAMGPSVNYLFSGTGLLLGSEVDYYDYSELKDMKIVIEDWVSDAENALRIIKGLPKIGEGWLNETLLYNIVSKIYEDLGYEVIHHSFPSFLGGQELDIHIPALNISIEYQGLQHYEPIEFFGGQEAFKRRVILDQRKKELCDANGVHLVYFRYDEPINEEFVRERLKKNT